MSKAGYKLHDYGEEVIKRNVDYDTNSTTFTSTCSRITSKNAIAIAPKNYRAVEFSDQVFILSTPMSPDETAKIYQITDPNAYIDWKTSNGERRLYPISKLKLLKEIKQPQVNKKLYNMSFSRYKS